MNDPLSATILVVDDEKQIHRFLRPALEAAGYRVLSAASAAEAVRVAGGHPPDAVLLDLGLPDRDGKTVIEQLRALSDPPVIVLSARDQEAEKSACLDAGAIDYVEKPFALGELLARLRSALRRRGRDTAEADGPLVCGPILLDPGRHEVRVEGARIALSPREHALLALLMRHRDRVITHRQILETIWGKAHVDDVQYLRVYIGQLRQKLGADAAKLVLTEPGIGYRLAVPDGEPVSGSRASAP